MSGAKLLYYVCDRCGRGLRRRLRHRNDLDRWPEPFEGLTYTGDFDLGRYKLGSGHGRVAERDCEGRLENVSGEK